MDKNPYQIAMDMFHTQGHDFQAVARILHEFVEAGGCIYVGPDAFGMARAVSTSWPQEAMSDYQTETPGLTSDLNCWHISYASGDIQSLLDKLPHTLPYVSMDRKGKFKIIKLQHLQRHG